MKKSSTKRMVLLLFLSIAFTTIYAKQLRVGDPGVTVQTNKFDPDYPQMERWANAGVRGGIPFIDSFAKVDTIDPGNSAKINAAINAMASSLSGEEMGLIYLRKGTYTINASVSMKSRVSLRGVNREEVNCSINMNSKEAFSFNNVKYCGLFDLTISGSWGTPKYPWNYSLDANREFSNDNISVKMKSGTTDCWLDRVTLLNAARDPMRCPANHNTFRNLIVDGCKRKAGGAEGYFFIQGGDNLVTGCFITHLRHISLQGSNVEYNVVYDNNFFQEVSFHTGDNGNNLIANNDITLPADMPPIEVGETGPYPETENGKPTYFAIMGPWSRQHTNSKHPNFLYRNRCLQLNHNYGPQKPWSDENTVYYGPKKLGLSNQERIDNFPAYDKGAPDGGVLYAIYLGEPIGATGIDLNKETITMKVNEQFTLQATVRPETASNKKVIWKSLQPDVVSVNNGALVANKEGTANIVATSDDGAFTATCTVTVTGLYKIPVESISLEQTTALLAIGNQIQLVYTITPNNAFNQDVIWSSNNTNVVTVNNGLIEAKALGSATIVVKTMDGNKTAECSVVVRESLTYVETFDNLQLNGWGDETFIGEHGFEWTVKAKGISDYIDGKGVYFHKETTGITSGPITGGIASFSADCLNKWSDGAERTIELLINGNVIQTYKNTGSGRYKIEANDINIEGSFELSIRNASASNEDCTIAFDNLSWTGYIVDDLPTSISAKEEKIKVYPNPTKGPVIIQEVNPGSKIAIYNILGSLLKSKTCLDSSIDIDLSSYPNGLYIIKSDSHATTVVKE